MANSSLTRAMAILLIESQGFLGVLAQMAKYAKLFIFGIGVSFLAFGCSMDSNKADSRSQNNSPSAKKTFKAQNDVDDDSESEDESEESQAQRSCKDASSETTSPDFNGDAAVEQGCRPASKSGPSEIDPDGGQAKPGTAKVELETFKPYVEPEEKKLCHDKGFPFKREHSEEYQYGRCDERATWPAPFECNFAGVLKAFNNNAKMKAELEKLTAEQWYFDDCGVINGKPIVFFACYRSGGANCVKIEEIKVGEVTIVGKSVTL